MHRSVIITIVIGRKRADAKTGRISTGLRNELGEVRCGAGMAKVSIRGEKNNPYRE